MTTKELTTRILTNENTIKAELAKPIPDFALMADTEHDTAVCLNKLLENNNNFLAKTAALIREVEAYEKEIN